MKKNNLKSKSNILKKETINLSGFNPTIILTTVKDTPLDFSLIANYELDNSLKVSELNIIIKSGLNKDQALDFVIKAYNNNQFRKLDNKFIFTAFSK